MKISKCLIKGKDYSRFLPYPYKETKVLDESLDNATFELVNLSQDIVFRPLTPVYIEITDGITTESRYAVVINDSISENVQLKKYNHQISIMEETKCLERFLIGGKTTTNSLHREYPSYKVQVYPEYENTPGNLLFPPISPETYMTPQTVNSAVTLLNVRTIFNVTDGFTTTLRSGSFIVYYNNEQIAEVQNVTDTYTLTFNREGVYKVEYRALIRYLSDSAVNVHCSYTFNCFADDSGTFRSSKTITEVIVELLETFEPIYDDEEPRFTLNSEQAEKFDKIESPEFSFSNQMTLWEALNSIGGYLHAIPRLRNSILYFDELGDNQYSYLALDKYSINETNYDIEQYCSKLISTVNNLVNYEEEGSIRDPGAGYQSLRVEYGQAYISEDNLTIKTQYPIENIVKLEGGYLGDTGTLIGDITPFVYERAEYDLLSSYDETYPYAKCYAIYYVQGEKDIKGLQFKADNSITNIGDSFKNYAIQNIIEKKTGVSIDIIKQIFGTGENDAFKLQNLTFKVTYQPKISARLEQTKPYKKDMIYSSEIAYNQDSTLINSSAFGENMRGAVSRLGTVEITRTYIFHNLFEIPKIGSLVELVGNEYYISNMILQYYQTFIQAQIGFSKDFNLWNRYVGVKNNIRFYDVSEKQCLDRYIFPNEFCVIGFEDKSDGKQMIKKTAVEKIIKQFNNTITAQDQEISAVVAKTLDANKQQIQEVILPAVSLGIGSNIYVGFEFYDNYSAGDKIIVTQDNIRTQQAVSYGDSQGRAKFIDIALHDNLSVPSNYVNIKEYADALPEKNQLSSGTPSVYIDKLVLDKDGRERISGAYTLNFITNNKKIVLGPGLTRLSRLVSSQTTSFGLYISPKRLNKFSIKNYDLSSFIKINGVLENLVYENIVDNQDNPTKFNLGNFNSPVKGKAWAIINTNDSEKNTLIIGENIDIDAGDIVSLPYFTFTRRIQEET